MIHTSLAAKKWKEFYFPNTKPSTQSQTNRLTTIYSYIAIHLATVAIPIKEFWHHNMQQEPEYEHAINHK